MERDLGEILDKYCKEIGPSNAITLYNNYAILTQTKDTQYTEQQYIKTADRFMRFYTFKYKLNEGVNLGAYRNGEINRK